MSPPHRTVTVIHHPFTNTLHSTTAQPGDYDTLQQRLTAATGRPPLPPDFTLGYMQSKLRYENQSVSFYLFSPSRLCLRSSLSFYPFGFGFIARLSLSAFFLLPRFSKASLTSFLPFLSSILHLRLRYLFIRLFIRLLVHTLSSDFVSNHHRRRPFFQASRHHLLPFYRPPFSRSPFYQLSFHSPLPITYPPHSLISPPRNLSL
jgi:hypothetical protein